jgi:hypothetical protein
MGIENTLIAGATKADIKRGCVLALDFRDKEQLKKLGATVYGSPVVDHGVDCDSTKALKIPSILENVFYSDIVTVRIITSIGLSFSNGIAFNMFDSGPTASDRFIVYKDSADNLSVRIGGTTVLTASSAEVLTRWSDIKINTVDAVMDASGNNTLRINGYDIKTSTTTWTKKKPSDLYVGSYYVSPPSISYAGTIYSFKVFQSALTLQEHIDAYQNKTYSYMQDALVHLPMTTDWYDSGSSLALDASGNGNDGTLEATVTKLDKRGFYFPGVSSYIDIYTMPSSLSGSFFVAVLLSDITPGTHSRVFEYSSGVPRAFAIDSSTGVEFYNGTGWVKLGYIDNLAKYTTLIYSFDDDNNNVCCFIDGVQQISSASVTPSVLSGSNSFFSNGPKTGNFLQCNAHSLVFRREKVTPTQAADIHNRMMEASQLTNAIETSIEQNRPFDIITTSIDPDPSEAGLVFASNMRPVGDVLPNLGTGVNGTIVGARHGKDRLGDYLRGNGTSYVSCGNQGTIKSISFWAKPDSTTEDFFDFDGGTHTIESTSGTLTATGFSSPSIFVNGVLSSTIVASKAQHVAISTDTGFSASALNAVLCAGNIYQIKINENEIDETYARREYKRGLTAMWKFSYGLNVSTAAASGRIENSDLIGLTGTYKIIAETISGDACKVLECQTTGTVQMPDRNMGDVDANNRCMYDSGSGYEWIDLTVTSGVVSMTAGDKMILASQGGTFDFTKRLLP